MHHLKKLAVPIIALLISALQYSCTPARASKCYGEQDCTACRSCNYCKNCNSGGTLCGVYYESSGTTPPWKKAPAKLPAKQAPTLPAATQATNNSYSRQTPSALPNATLVPKNTFANPQTNSLSCQLGNKKLNAISIHIFNSEPMPPGLPNSPAGHKVVSVSYRKDAPSMIVWLNLIDKSSNSLYPSFVPNKTASSEICTDYFAIPDKSLAHPFELMFLSGGQPAADARIQIPSLLELNSRKTKIN